MPQVAKQRVGTAELSCQAAPNEGDQMSLSLPAVDLSRVASAAERLPIRSLPIATWFNTGAFARPVRRSAAERPTIVRGLGEVHLGMPKPRAASPGLTSIVVRRQADGNLGTPGPGYFALVFPQVRDDAARLRMWQEEVRRGGVFLSE